MKISIAQIKPNPFRHIDRYPIKQEKVDALKKSITDTSYWGNILARPNSNGPSVEIAYGHHRLVALKEMFGPDKEVDLIMRDLDDTAMAKIMAHENMDEWGSQADVEQETIRAIIEGYANGRINLGSIGRGVGKQNLRYAPNFKVGPASGSRDYPYTTAMLCNFLGWMDWKVRATLHALEVIEEGQASEDDYKGLNTDQADALSNEIRKTKKQGEARLASAKKTGDQDAVNAAKREVKAEVKKVRRIISKELKSGEINSKGARERASGIRFQVTEKHGQIPDINPVAKSLAGRIHNFLDPDKATGKKTAEVIKFKEYLDHARHQDLLMSLRTIRDYADEHINALEK